MAVTLSEHEAQFVVEVLKSAKTELEELERELDWYVTAVPEELKEALEIFEGDNKD